jgi:hypothetical protein
MYKKCLLLKHGIFPRLPVYGSRHDVRPFALCGQIFQVLHSGFHVVHGHAGNVHIDFPF